MNVQSFLNRHGLCKDIIDIEKYAPVMLEHMKAGLEGRQIDMPMIPTYLKGVSDVPKNKPVMVIDAGGTNFRCGLATFTDSGCSIEGLVKSKMPGTDGPVTWDEFISFVADSLVPFAGASDIIGFCFSYEAEMTPEIDGIVHTIDKEVVVTGCKGKKIGESLCAALAMRGFPGKRVIILNDTVAALLGGSTGIDVNNYSDFIGMICGTGINTCAPAAIKEIKKISSDMPGTMLINFESGAFSAMPRADIDKAVDEASLAPGEKLMEKMCSGAYVGTVLKLALIRAVDEGYLSESVKSKLENLDSFGGGEADAIARGENELGLFKNSVELDFASAVARAVFERSARCMAAVILAIALMNDSGKDSNKPVCVCAEGSLISRSRYFLPELERSLEEIANGKYARFAEIVLGNETTLPGSAVAALLNT